MRCFGSRSPLAFCFSNPCCVDTGTGTISGFQNWRWEMQLCMSWPKIIGNPKDWLPQSKAKRLWSLWDCIYHGHDAQCGQSSVDFCGVGGWTNFTWGASGRFVTGWVTWAGIFDDESCRRDVTHLIESLEFLLTCTILEGRPIFRKIVFWGIPCRQNIVRQVS